MRGGHLALVAMLCLCGCSSFESDRHARELSGNRLDDEYCAGHGLRYPDPGYVQCRRQLVDKRLYRDWQNLRVMRQGGQAPSGSGAVPAFHRPDPEGFHCHAEPQFGNQYVFCGYEGPDAGP